MLMYHFGGKRNDILIFQFDNRRKMNETFIRLSEFNDNKKFADKIVTVEDIKKWYKDNHKINYMSYWDGHNIPDYIITSFKKKYKSFTPQEKWLFNKVDMYNHNTKYCVIATQPDKEIILHELCHAMFYGNKEYRREALKLLREVNTRKIQKLLYEKYAYHERVLEDETIAYLIDGNEDTMPDAGVKGNIRIKKLQNQLLLNYAKFISQNTGRLIRVP